MTGCTLATRIRRFARTALFSVAFVFLTLGRLPGCAPAGHRDDITSVGPKSGDAAAFSRTIVTPHLEHPIAHDRNILWCATFQLAWTEVCTLIGEDVHFDRDPSMVAPLNARRVTWADVDRASCVAVAGFVRDGIFDRIRAELAKTFRGEARPQLIPNPANARPQDIVAYAYLYKNLEFPTPFERLETPLDFGAARARVASFGVGPNKAGPPAMYDQVTILDYKSADDFVIELTTKSPDDRVILAKIARQPTLQAAVDHVASRQPAGLPATMSVTDVLQVPKFNFDIRRNYAELLWKRLRVANPKVASDLFLLQAMQDIRFEMNEIGVKLRSEAVMHFGCSAASPPPPVHVLIFDKPFLVLLQRRASRQPYFALWVQNAELLIPKPPK